jgi:hypothetical protein
MKVGRLKWPRERERERERDRERDREGRGRREFLNFHFSRKNKAFKLVRVT